jgi:hypothetical protein
METLSIYAGSINDVSPVDKDTIEVTLDDVDLSHLVAEVGPHFLLAEMDISDIYDFIEEKRKLDEEERQSGDE